LRGVLCPWKRSGSLEQEKAELEKVKKQTVFFTPALNRHVKVGHWTWNNFTWIRTLLTSLLVRWRRFLRPTRPKLKSTIMCLFWYLYFFPILKWYIINKITLIFIILFVFIFILYLYKMSRLYCLLRLI